MELTESLFRGNLTVPRVLLLLSLSLYLVSITGCVSVPHDKLNSAIEPQELSDHVNFLAQPSLKGRKPKTLESATARQYLQNRFKSYGLVTWPDTKSYEQPFGFGTNIIGVLTGSDPNLANEIVIVAAHYDHVGKTKKGTLLGACDNASGVAALLEIAENLSQNRPKRSICFAAFDCEENFALGAVAFTCRKNFSNQKIVAMVNIDLLGRDFLEIVDGSLFVMGSQTYPQLHKEILLAAENTDIKILPIGKDIVGQSGDHAAFATMDIPVLFFTCGLYKDYHKPTDTPEKLNYSKMTSSAAVITTAVNLLANSQHIEEPLEPQSGNTEELKSLKLLIDLTSSRYQQLGLTAEQSRKLAELTAEAQTMLDGENYTITQHRSFTKKAIEALLPALAVADDAFAGNNEWVISLNELFTKHTDFVIESYRDMVRQLLENKPSLFSKVNYSYDAWFLSDEDFSIVQQQDGQYQLDAILSSVTLNFQKNGLSGSFNFQTGYWIDDFLGTKEQMTDYCLLLWRKNLKNESYGQAWVSILSTVTGQQCGKTYNDWLKWQLEKKGFATEEQWLQNLRNGDNTKLANVKLAWAAGGKRQSQTPEEFQAHRKELRAIIKDPNASPDARTNAVWSVNYKGKEELLTLVETLDDKTPSTAYKNLPRHVTDKSYPLANHERIKDDRKWWEKQQQTPPTIGDDAQLKLLSMTEQHFGKDTKKWRKWIKAHIKS